jgi:hypothetical protein
VIIKEVEKNPNEKQIDIARCLGLAPSTPLLQMKRKSGNKQASVESHARKGRQEGNLLSASLSVSCWFGTCKHRHLVFLLTAMYYVKRPSRLLIECKLTISLHQMDRFVVKDYYGPVHKKLAGKSATADINRSDLWLERLQTLLEGYEPWGT